jgi:hypothetical protein
MIMKTDFSINKKNKNFDQIDDLCEYS